MSSNLKLVTKLYGAFSIVEAELQNGEKRARQVIGVVFDAVSEVLDILPSDIEPAPAFCARTRNNFPHSMGKFVNLLNFKHVLSLDEIGGLGAAPATSLT